MDSHQKLRVLFVDDEPMILEMVPRLLGHFRDNWHVETALGTADGLNRIRERAFDVVVSDLNMPGMGGMEFLKEVRLCCPSAARIIFSSYADKHSVLDCFDLIHQFLPKPVANNLLIATIQRAAMIRSLLPDDEIRGIVSNLDHVPSMPTLYLELTRQLNNSEASIQDIAETVSHDIGMTARFLKMVNSAYFGLPESTSCVEKAISHLGIEMVKYLALTAGVFSQFETRKMGGISMETLWTHSLRTASAAKQIATSENAGSRVIEAAMAAGLLHDIGKLVLATSFPDKYENVGRTAQSKQLEWLVAEREAFGFDHAEVGGYLLGLWGLPRLVVEAVAFHHFPSRGDQSCFSPLTAVHAADVLVQTERASHGGYGSPQIDFMYLAKSSRPHAVETWGENLQELASL